ncbi:GNAT family N-acetyltransferase [Salibacterium qingdaonense]|uniref:Predicted N-acyltransferase, GNAT family n=1 Tax=Salibacterium qingdaonense TaxID=266892 RepID=A0A1I4IK14_9BACI|nr:GNAT family N-acetyltransferase [Salibacterium qingdaonense]SFL54712.1 Predicted N-acyltransferase, GNAT family [Salibacterium qingdaonense]
MITVFQVQDDKQQQDAYHVRFQVFVHEQNVPEEMEMDEYDETGYHFTAYDDHLPVGAGRLRFVDNVGKAERVCVLSSYRSTGTGRAIMEKMEQTAKNNGASGMKLNAQISAADFYKKLGYTVTSGEFYDAGMPHVEMKKTWT